MEETDQHKPLLLESQGDANVEKALEEEEDKQRSGLKKAWFSIATAVVVFHLFYTSLKCRSKMELMAPVVLPAGVEVSDLHWFAPQYRALRWLACKDPRHMTIDDDATELLERFSLVTFYYSVGGDSLRRSRNHDWSRWLINSSHCEWDYIKCDEDGRVSTLCTLCPLSCDEGVTALDIYNSKMHGTLPTEIGNFKRLRELNLGINELVGPIPSEIGHLQQLKSLGLSNNKFSGPIPSEILHLQQLERLSLAFNRFSGPIPSEIGHLQQLEILELRLNTFSGPIPSEVGNLQQLKVLGLEYNKLSGPIPSEIGRLQQLHGLGLEYNKFSGPIPSEFGHLQQLEYLGLDQNKFSGPIPSEIGQLQQLTSLALSDNIGLTGTVPVEVGQLKSINRAFFSNTSLTGGLDDLALCKKQQFMLRADCGGLNPKITCECCTECCGIDENGWRLCDDD
eukprot:scaffold8156_cov101-Cylindrotheca_fusiformis.AAC.6